MKNLNTFEEFLNESNRTKRGNNKINFLKDSTSEIDHTRLVKWMGKNIDSNKYYFEKSKTVGYWILDVEKLSERELKDLLQYLESEKYKFGTQIWLPAYESEINEDQRFLNFRYGNGIDKISISPIEDFRKGKKTNKDFEKTANHFGSISGVFVLTAKDSKEVKTINSLAKKNSVTGLWTIDNDNKDVFITRAN